MWLFLLVLVLLCMHPSLGTLKGPVRLQHGLSSRSLRVSVVGGQCGTGGPGDWAVNLVAEFPACCPPPAEAENRLLSSALCLDKASWRAGLGVVPHVLACSVSTSAAPLRHG